MYPKNNIDCCYFILFISLFMSDNIIIMDFDEGIRKRKMVREYDQVDLR
jgi:hypothetical protein